ncbi:MAG: amylo-alpha-1,6-glucosidase [Candidatus Bathyarchaeia archaeon]
MNLPTINLNREILSNFEDALKREWIITNGLGGYASSTVFELNTRKYHGLLVAALHPPGDRRVCLAKLDEEVGIEGETFHLGTNEFQNGIFPQGHRFLSKFSVSTLPKYLYTVKDVEVEKNVFMPHGKNAVVVIYRVLNKSAFTVVFRVFPLINWRHIHSVTNRHEIPWEFIQMRKSRAVDLNVGATKSALLMEATSGRYCPTGRWVERLYYREEALRGESCLDDCYQPGYFEIEVPADKGEVFAIKVVADKDCVKAHEILAEMPRAINEIESLYGREMKRRENLLTKFYEASGEFPAVDWLKWIVLAGDNFIVGGMNDEQRRIIAGYHWFEAWGRDTFVSLPGLMLATGRFEDARKAFLTFKKYCRDGLIPNFIPNQMGQPAYNSVDATLWFFNAVLQYLKYTNDFKFVKEQLWDTLRAVIEKYVKGADFGIHVDADGLLSHGPQLTWMDAAVDDEPVTPRFGKAVEVQALWFNALKIGEFLAKRFNENGESEKYAKMADKARQNFVETFWNSEKNCLFDVISEHGKDSSLRPNQIIAVALDFTMLDKVKGEKIVDVVHRELLTPYGLRTLAKSDPRYVGVYAGDRRSRDKAYHNGTAWPWLLGPFTTAFLKVKGYTENWRKYALEHFLLPLFTQQTLMAGLGTISEIFDGDSPHMPRGCIAQAWSVAEPLRAYVEDVMLVRPKYEGEILQGLG